jgi:hypothetical protein
MSSSSANDLEMNRLSSGAAAQSEAIAGPSNPTGNESHSNNNTGPESHVLIEQTIKALAAAALQRSNPRLTGDMEHPFCYNKLAVLLQSRPNRDEWPAVLATIAAQCNVPKLQSPEVDLDEVVTNVSDDAMKLMTAVVAIGGAKGYDKVKKTNTHALRRFAWLNHINLLHHQHELIKLEAKYRQNLLLLLEPNEPSKLRQALEEYSTTHSLAIVLIPALDTALLNYQQIKNLDDAGFSDGIGAQLMFEKLDYSYRSLFRTNLCDLLKIAPTITDPLRKFLSKHLPERLAYDRTSRNNLKVLRQHGNHFVDFRQANSEGWTWQICGRITLEECPQSILLLVLSSVFPGEYFYSFR